jgi:hypothetical protein
VPVDEQQARTIPLRLQGSERSEDHGAVSAEQQREPPAAAGSADRLRHLLDHRHQGVLGQQAGRAAHRDGNRQHQIARIGEPQTAGQCRCQATLAQHGRASGNPVHRATGIGGHADQGESGWRHPIDATGPSRYCLPSPDTVVRLVHSSPAAYNHQNLRYRAPQAPQKTGNKLSLSAAVCAAVKTRT